MFKRKEKGYLLYNDNWDWLCGSVRIEKKRVLDYIKGKGKKLYGDDFYFAYTWKDGILKYVLVKSDEYLEGRKSVLGLVLVKEGVYRIYSLRKKVWYQVISGSDGIEVKVSKEEVEGEDLLSLVRGKDVKVPVLQWSLKRERDVVFFISVMVFVIAFGFFMSGLLKRKESSNIVQSQAITKVSEEKKGCFDVVNQVMKVSDFMKGKGVIKKVEFTGNKVDFKIDFDSQVEVESFLKSFQGARNEGKTVFYSVSDDC